MGGNRLSLEADRDGEGSLVEIGNIIKSPVEQHYDILSRIQ